MEFHLGDAPVTAHSWNGDRTSEFDCYSWPNKRINNVIICAFSTDIAVIPNSNEVQIYKYEPNVSDWTLLDNLDQHGLLVTGIDWAPNTNRIVTCSAVSINLFIVLNQFYVIYFHRTVMHTYGQSTTKKNGNRPLFY